MVPVVRIALDDDRQAAQAHRYLDDTFGEQVRVQCGGSGQRGVVLLPIASVAEAPPTGEKVIAVGDLDLPKLVDLMAKRPWLNHVVSPRFFEGGVWGTALGGAVWRALVTHRRLTGAPFFGTTFRGRQARISDSARRSARIDRVAEFARKSGASATVSEQVRDVAEELITNALYDAPAERLGRPADRSSRVLLDREDACVLTYGVARQTFFVRLRDTCGSLRRRRMFEVLQRCAAGDRGVDIDSSRGGAGLGMWRIFSTAALVVVHVREGETTEFTLGIDLQRGRRATRGRAIHLFFEGATEAFESRNRFEVQP